MAIITENINSNPMGQAVFAISQEAPVVTLPKVGTAIDFCTCDYECEYYNYVFADAVSNEDFKNDKSSFLVGVSDSSSILQITLIGPTLSDETIIDDNTFGQYFDKGSFTNTNNQLNYYGFVADWQKILLGKGAGTYFFKFKETTFGKDFETESVKYKLLPYNETQIAKTLRFKFIQNGLIENGLDYTGLNWEVQVRVSGKLRYQASTLEQDNYLIADRTVTQIQDKKISNFEIETGLIPSSIGDLLENNTLANNILITNYDWFAYKRLEDFAIIFFLK